MSTSVRISKSDARRALIRHHFSPFNSQMEVFDRLRSIQFDPIAPAGCNHDLVLQSRLPEYRIGDWEKVTYEDRLVYDGWDKQASLVPFSGWPLRRYFYHRSERARKSLEEHAEAAKTILAEIEERGPLMPKECFFQEHREELKGSWWGPSLAKNVLRLLWHTGRVMTSGRKKGQHLYDLTERIVPQQYLDAPGLTEEESVQGIALERHRALGMLRPTAGYETWSYIYAGPRQTAIQALINLEEIVSIEVEGMKAHATPAFLHHLDEPGLEPEARFIAPLDQLVWDRGLLQKVFDFDYIWEIYTPEAKRRWGYYVLPVLYGDTFAGRVEFWARKGTLEIRRWHWEGDARNPKFMGAFEPALRRFANYAGAERIVVDASIDSAIKDLAVNLEL
ncbi:MAG TPA: crosslink repair DNA glycosylase YcaQ family protein [Fimbriimonadaceae bacterium]|nr:crosslink repair DNA glycosylase YcaQ family protein [Fimbriimonadaceae bacterium]